MKTFSRWFAPALIVLLYATVVWCLAAENDLVANGILEVFPSSVKLESMRSSQAIVSRIIDINGITHDVSASAKLSTDPKLAKLIGPTVIPAADGQGFITVDFEGHRVTVPLETRDSAVDPPVSFKRDVMPVFMKAGCNTGGCHGSARGKDGFHLSLFGYDPDGDYFRLTRELGARRVNLAMPGESLLLQKATGSVAHTGGKRFDKDSEMYKTLLRWIEAGAQNDPKDVPVPTSLEILPKDILLEENGTQQMCVVAHYSNGAVRDVTPLTVFLSNNESSAKVSPEGLITAGQRGEGFVMARFATFTVGSEVAVIPKDFRFEFPKVREANYIDKAVYDKLRRLRIAPSNVCSDEDFLRRVYIDTIGMLPTVEEHDRFMSSTGAEKRKRLVDDLLARPEFVDLWAMKMAELLEIRSSDTNNVSYKATLLYFNWLKEHLAKNVPINQIVRELVSASGGTFANPPANFYMEEIDPLKLAENCAQSFLGIRVQCAQCHNHPFDQWTMNDYRGFVGFFSQVGRKKAEDPRESIVFNSGEGESKHPITNQPVVPRFLGGNAPEVTGKDRRTVLAEWLTSEENPWFAKHFANLVWAQFFGRGIIEPVDDVRVSNPAANTALLDQLGRKLVEYHYDFRRLIHDICDSATYQLSSITNESNEADVRNFSHAAIRRLRAEVMLDCLSEATGTHDKFRGLPIGARAVQIADGHESSYFLRTFGRATRETVCTCEVAMDPNLSQALHLLNGDTVQRKITDGALVKKMIDAKITIQEIVDQLYLRCLARKPDDQERDRLKPLLGMTSKEIGTSDTRAPESSGTNPASTPLLLAKSVITGDQQKRLEDLLWALLNSKEFMFNH